MSRQSTQIAVVAGSREKLFLARYRELLAHAVRLAGGAGGGLSPLYQIGGPRLRSARRQATILTQGSSTRREVP